MEEKTYLLVSAVALILVAVAMTFYSGPITGFLVGETVRVPKTGSLEDIPQLSLEGYVKPSIDTASNVIYLTNGCYRLSMFTTELQTSSIERGKKKVREFRPLSHDLIEDIIDTFDMEVLMVKIEKLEGNTYFSKILIKQGNKILNLDARPSDAIAIAVRTDAPVYVKEDLLKKAGTNIC